MKMQRIYISILAFGALIGCSKDTDRMIESLRITYYVENTPEGSITYNFYDSELLKLIFFETEKGGKTFFVNWDGTKSTEEQIRYGVMQSHGLARMSHHRFRERLDLGDWIISGSLFCPVVPQVGCGRGFSEVFPLCLRAFLSAVGTVLEADHSRAGVEAAKGGGLEEF